jgi:hypothetical protein
MKKNFIVELTEERLAEPISIEALAIFSDVVHSVYSKYLNKIGQLLIVLFVTILLHLYGHFISILLYFIILILLCVNIFEILKLRPIFGIINSQHIIYTHIYLNAVSLFLNNFKNSESSRLIKYIKNVYKNNTFVPIKNK